jgi:DNA-binding LacI/PurR family transcriptional regulator
MTTIVDVAKKAGVSVSTVSYALSGVRRISEKTRQRVLKAVEELDYHPNLLARGLVNKRTKIIALLYPAIASDFLDDLQLDFIASVAKTSSHYGYGLLLFTSPMDKQEITRFTNEGLVDGVILMEVQRHDPRVELLKELGYPFSLIGHTASNEGNSFVDMDFYGAFHLCIRHLAELKHREIAFLPIVNDYETQLQNYLFESVRGFEDSVRTMGIQGVIHSCESTTQGGYEAMKALLEERPGLSAIIAGTEPIYTGAARALLEKGLRVPMDFSVIGFMSPRAAEKYTPMITTLTLPTTEMGRIGVESLINKLEGQESEPQQVILPPELTVRQSTSQFSKSL